MTTMLRVVAVVATIAGCGGVAIGATITPDLSSPSYLQGSQDRDAWETWYHSLAGPAYDGASWWAANRTHHPAPCLDQSKGDQDWLGGCENAKRRLASVDYLRRTDPQYWNGWNKKVPFTPGVPGENPNAAANVPIPHQSMTTPGVPTDHAGATRYCVTAARKSMVYGSFDAYYDPAASIWHTLGPPAGSFYFTKCMTELGFSLGKSTSD
jgi:hypothetical protein